MRIIYTIHREDFKECCAQARFEREVKYKLCIKSKTLEGTGVTVLLFAIA